MIKQGLTFAEWAAGLTAEQDATSGTRLGALRTALLDEPLLPASLGAKELFHSNLLAWACRQFPHRAQLMLAPWLTPSTSPGRHRVRREFRHLDVVIEFPGFEPLVIENKLTALPDEEQLARYTRDALKDLGDPTLVLLSLADPGWPDDCATIAGRQWSYVSYRQLAERIASQFWGEQGFAEAVLEHEARLTYLLDRVVADVAVRRGGETFELASPVATMLAEIGLDDAVGKIRGAQVMRRITATYESRGIAPSWTEVGLSHGQPLLSAYWRKANGDCVGWQLQGRQWRLAMILTSLEGRSQQQIAAREQYAKRYETWFDFSPLGDALGADETSLQARTRGGSDGWQRFNPDFVYRYRLLPSSTSVDQVVEAATRYGERAQQWRW